ncbi:hypothetical protein Pcinc_035838 [Petrolisthes cinctipes]|uniref:Cyclase n=1 Tax=Petrolisthes cinctipes TaxID=88211 RepID=A0AAE1EMX5_PETCI|nr:hypothetical protein Pcinc_035838 [Petrolisthes cinctipes]
MLPTPKPPLPLLLLPLLLLLLLLQAHPGSCDLIDLSYTYNLDAPNNPNVREFTLIPVKSNDKKTKKNSWSLNEFCTSEHSGTHIDAPKHYNRDGWPLDAIPTHRFWRRPGIMLDVSEEVKASRNPNFEVLPKHLKEFEARFGLIPDGAVVLIRTGQGSKVRNITAYSGLDRDHKMNHAGISKDAAEWISAHIAQPAHNQSEGIVGVGVDTLSLDKGILFNSNIYGLENLANLEKLPPSGFYITVLPLSIHGGSGAPARVVAETGDTIALHSAAVPTNTHIYSCSFCLILLLCLLQLSLFH